jgi:hypothetical protein
MEFQNFCDLLLVRFGRTLFYDALLKSLGQNRCTLPQSIYLATEPLSTKLSPVGWALPATTRKAYSIVGVQCPPDGYWEWGKMSV